MQFHQDDIASDLSVFHRIDDPDEMPGPLYFDRAERLPHYRGVLRDLAIAEGDQTSTTTPATGSTPRTYQAQGTNTVQGTRGALETNVSTAGLIDWE